MTGWRKWTRDEINICLEDIPEEEVMERTGRTLQAVRSKRSELTGHCKAKCERKEYEVPYERISTVMESWERVNRIHWLAAKYGVRLKK